MPPDDNRNSDSQPLRDGPGTIARYAVSDLLRDAREAILVHNGAEYRLRITANGRLILTK
ncbi:MAG: hemin uptake protein HemP [Rhizobiales bacterium]|nr:hemin uptake protein HemP [Hyphomicrobiales bacterium]